MTNTEIIKEIKTIKKTWKPSRINVITHDVLYYSNGGYYVDVVKFEYNGVIFQINISNHNAESVLFEV